MELSAVHDAILLYLRYDETGSVRELAEKIRYHRTTVTKALDELSEAGYVDVWMEYDEHSWRAALTWEGSRQIEDVLARTFVRLKFCDRTPGSGH